MTINYINTGSSANKGDGDTLRTAFNKINANFQYLSTATGSGGSGNATITSSVTPPAGAVDNTLWFNTNEARTYIKYSGAWVDASPQITPPSIFPADNIGVLANDGNGILSWTTVSGSSVSYIASATAPANTSTIWYDTVSGRSYVYYDSSWVDANPAVETLSLTSLKAVISTCTSFAEFKASILGL